MLSLASSPSLRRRPPRNKFSPPDVLWLQLGGTWSAPSWRHSALILSPRFNQVSSALVRPFLEAALPSGFSEDLVLRQVSSWWAAIYSDTKEFVSACSVCARGKASHCAPAGLLQPLPVPHRSWSHIALDFVTGLPTSQGNIVILTIIDRFSKAMHFVPLSKLPLALETTNLLGLHVFKQHGIPVDIVSDRGPQFIIPGLEGILLCNRGLSQPLLGIPPTIQQADGAG